ncbi:hypothetical protein [Robiginitalea marina]|uniref:Uncharacterized protein n=1 Tax=Robiginitalea marina TaxID=2954105 RepID=A0ABT1AVH0_9FLAO|nr:hypothetical protein [Robiginitalea marina]MCO5723612.1 hypothetical protein [Robiginitalea marina]
MDGKYKKLVLGLVLDGVGMASLLLPGLGDFLDVLWAPVAAWCMTRLYPGKKGRVAGIIAFVEEIFPGLDLIPTFTLMWVYTYLLSRTKGAQPA